MADESLQGTSILVQNLLTAPHSPQAWRAFVDRYERRVYGWCRRWGVQDADAEDVKQEVLLKLWRHLGTYQRDRGPFRKWISTVAHNALADARNDQLAEQRVGNDRRSAAASFSARQCIWRADVSVPRRQRRIDPLSLHVKPAYRDPRHAHGHVAR